MKDPIWQHLADEIEDFYDNIAEQDFIPQTSPKEIRDHLREHYDFQSAVPLERLQQEIETMMRKWGLHTPHPRYFGLFNPAVTKASILADAYVALYNPNVAVWNHAPVSVEIERHVLRYLLARFGFDPDDGIASFTSGGAEANFTSVIAALTWKFPEYDELGLRATPGQPVFYASEQAHHSLMKIAHMSGLGRHALRIIPSDESLRIRTDLLEKQIAKDKAEGFAPFMIVGTVGTTNAGTVDDLATLDDIADREGLWLHADAAWAGTAALSDTTRPHLGGIHRADSITCDAHKWLSVSMGAGIFLCKNQKVAEDAFRIATAYMPQNTESVVEPYVSSMQWSRRFIGLKVFMTLLEAGEDGIAARINRQTELGELLKSKLKDAGFVVVNDTPLPVACFTHEAIRSGVIDPQAVLDYFYKNNIAWISRTELQGEPVLRACISNYRTDEGDVDALVGHLSGFIS
jgi:aromatic-L-amino-acid decarboxylase